MSQKDRILAGVVNIKSVCFAGVEGCTPPADGSRRGQAGRWAGKCAKADVVVDPGGHRPEGSLYGSQDVKFGAIAHAFVAQVLGDPGSAQGLSLPHRGQHVKVGRWLREDA